jgi:hypothetical protein
MLTTVEARAAVDRLRAEKTRAGAEIAARRKALDALETASGDRLLTARLEEDDTAAASIRAELTEARAAVADLEAIATAADRAIKAAELDVLLAEATEARDEAAALWSEATTRLKTTARLLDELEAHEGVRFAPPPHVEPSGVVDPTRPATTRTGELVGKILALETRATALETRTGRAPSPSIMGDRIQSLPGGPSIVAPQRLKVSGSQLLPEPRRVPTSAEIAAARGEPRWL